MKDFFGNLYKKTLLPAGQWFARAAQSIWAFIVKLWKHKKGRTGIIIVSALVLVALLAPLLTPYDPKATVLTEGLQSPSWKHLLGTDKNGTDILAQIIYGTRMSLFIGLTTGILVTLAGAILGIAAGYFHKAVGGTIMRIADVLLVIPTLPLIIILNDISPTYGMLITVFILFGWMGTARIIRAQVLSLKNSNHIKAAELFGANKWYIMFRHILPAVSHLLIMNCALASAGFMVAEAGLSFLGLGDPNAVSWGKLIVRAQSDALISRLWAWVLAPGAAIFIAVMGFMRIGSAMEEIFNPKLSNMRAALGYHFTDVQVEEAFASMEELSVEEAERIFRTVPARDAPDKKIRGTEH